MEMSDTYFNVVNDVLSNCKKNDYKGYEKFDALNSPFLDTITIKNQWLRFIAIQVVKECPIHIRPILGVKKMRNTKGMALFARSNLFLYETYGDKKYLKEAKEIIDWLIINKSPNQKNYCWGYEFLWQSMPPFCQDRNEPNLVVTCFVGEAIYHYYTLEKNEKYLEVLKSITKFITEDLPVLFEDGNSRAISYLLSQVDSIALNNQVMSAVLLVKINTVLSDAKIALIARKQMQFTVNNVTDYYCWAYAVPVSSSKKPVFIDYHDNYHTGGILDALIEYYETTGEDSFNHIYWKALEYYKVNFFDSNGIPKWSDKSKYPIDIHSAAQGIITFVKASKHEEGHLVLAQQILDWTLAYMYRKQEQDFIYRKSRVYNWNFSLVRWSNAWMSIAIAEYLLAKANRTKASRIE